MPRDEQIRRPVEYRRYTDRTSARIEFLRAIGHDAPDVLATLRETVLPAFIVAANGLDARITTWSDPHALEALYTRLRPAVEAWATQHHLGPDPPTPAVEGIGLVRWMEPVIAFTLQQWHAPAENAPPALDGWSFPSMLSAGALMHTAEPFRFELDGWSPLQEQESRPEFRQRAELAFHAAIDSYLSRAVPSDGWFVRLPTRSTRSHFTWLVRRQVRGESFAAIARAAGLPVESGRQTIQNAVWRLAEEVIGPRFKDWLALSPSVRGGRPRR